MRRTFLLSWGVFLAAFLALDAVWLTVMGKRLYAAELGGLVAERPRVAPAIAFYLLYSAGVTAFCVTPSARSGDVLQALARGAGFGLVAYATYDLTNQATLAHWSTRVTVLDLLWGAAATGAAVAATVWLLRRRTSTGRLA